MPPSEITLSMVNFGAFGAPAVAMAVTNQIQVRFGSLADILRRNRDVRFKGTFDAAIEISDKGRTRSRSHRRQR